MNYVLTGKADQDLEEIYDYTLSSFGQEQAENYFNSLINHFEKIMHHPEIGVSRGEVVNKIRSLIVGLHTIFYLVKDDHIVIVRVLHQSRDLPKNFDVNSDPSF